MKKFILFVYIIINICFSLTSCVTQNVKAGPMNELIGTYKLTKYDVTPERTEETENTPFYERKQDMLELYKVEAYLIVTGKKVGYYYYKDIDTSWKVDTIRIDYHYAINTNNEQTNLIREIYFTDELSTDAFIPGHGSERPGFNSLTHTLNYTQHSYRGKYVKVENTTSVEYKLVSKDITPNYVETTIGQILPIPYYELKNLNGIFQYSMYDTNPNVIKDLNPFIYCYIDFDNNNLNSTIYYALKEDYKNGLRNDKLKKTSNTKVDITSDENYVYVDFNFNDADDSAIYKLTKDYCETIMYGMEFYYKYDSNVSKYVVTNEKDNSSIYESLNLLNNINNLTSRIDNDIENYNG